MVGVVILLMIHILEYIAPSKEQNMNVKAINLMSMVNQTKLLVQNESCECKYGLNSKQKWNHGECWCKCDELDDWSSCKDP